MANEEENKITAEKLVHDFMAEVANRVYADYRIAINSVEFEWTDVSSLAEQKLVVREVTIGSTTNP